MTPDDNELLDVMEATLDRHQLEGVLLPHCLCGWNVEEFNLLKTFARHQAEELAVALSMHYRRLSTKEQHG